MAHIDQPYCACWFCTLGDDEDDYEDLDCEDCCRLQWPCATHHAEWQQVGGWAPPVSD